VSSNPDFKVTPLFDAGKKDKYLRNDKRYKDNGTLIGIYI